MALKTDYKNDIPKTPLRKYNMIQNADGTVSFEEVTEFLQIGDSFGAGDINTTNEAVNRKVESTDIVNHNLATEPGFAADALDVKNQFDEQNKNLEWKFLGSGINLGKITLPNEFSELSIDIQMKDIGYGYLFHLTREQTIGNRTYFNGFNNNLGSNVGSIKFSNNELVEYGIEFNGGNYTSTTIASVYYR